MFSSERHTERRKALHNRLQFYRSPAEIQIFLQTEELKSPCSLSVQNKYTIGPLADTNVFVPKTLRFLFLVVCIIYFPLLTNI